ncbi:peptidase S24 [Bacteroides fragilis]|uniref:Peptidase S24 n=1 Tax=Bacteroides fragilis TaxID=817 RepID=A0A396C5M5_BACFG|nr:translesion error-prone DNA polymerase V autoproteolytic subunit [Bacteroides fragilis]RHH14373.1 peptidase S24 [Bacteroides fragilis]
MPGNKLEIFRLDSSGKLELQLADEGIQAGFPSPSQDYMELTYDLNRELIKNPASTFMGRVKGMSMGEEGIHPGDLLIIDKSLELEDNDLAVCFLDGEFTLKRVEIDKDSQIIWLVPSNTEFKKIKVTEDNQFLVWGIVIYIIKDIRKKRR